MKPNHKLTVHFTGALAIAALLGVAACEPKTTDSPAPEGSAYAIFGSAGTGTNIQTLVLETKSLIEGTLSALGSGIDITASNFAPYTAVQKDGIFYNIDGTAGKLGKYRFAGGRLETIKEVPLSALTYFNGYQWTDENTLFLTQDGFTQFKYAIINTETLTVTKTGILPIQTGKPGDQILIGAHHIRDGKLHLFYSVYPDGTNAADDTARVAVMDYPALTNVTISKDTRSTFPGAGFGNTPGAFEDENGDLYVITAPGPWTGARPEIPTGILRVKKGSRTFDSAYFFNTTAATNGQHQQGLWYLGNGKAIVKSSTKEWSYDDPSIGFAYYVVDVRTQTMSELPTVPRTTASFSGEVLVENGKARIGVDTDLYVYTYDPTTNSVTKGLKLEGLNTIDLLTRVD